MGQLTSMMHLDFYFFYHELENLGIMILRQNFVQTIL